MSVAARREDVLLFGCPVLTVLALDSGTYVAGRMAGRTCTNDPGYVREMRQTLAASDWRRGVDVAWAQPTFPLRGKII